jgi:putative endonuclease
MAVGEKKYKQIMSHFIYILRCADETLYTGYTTSIEKRLEEHNGEGSTKKARSAGSKYTRPRRPVKMVYNESYATRSEAMQREYAIKQLTREEKLQLIHPTKKVSMAKGKDQKKEVKKPKKDKTIKPL